MSAAVSLLLDVTTVRIVTRDGRVAREVPWSPDAPDAMVAAVRALVGSPSAIVVVVGLGFLEIAQPDLPPMADDARRAVLWRDADRYFPLDEPVAVVCADAFAFALPSRHLDRWVRAIRTLGPVRAIVTAPQLCARVLGTGSCALPAGSDERGLVHVRDGRLEVVRRAASSAAAGASAGATSRDDAPDADALRLGREALGWMDAPLDAQLLDAPLADGLRRARRRRWVASVAMATLSVLLLLWSADRLRGSELAALEMAAALLADSAAPAMRAEARQSRAQAEVALLTTADSARRSPDAPLAVLAQLSRILPKDAFVQRLEWDGQLWRVDGTADNARRLVPLLDGDAHFQDVRIASASQRFLDAGRQRESFAISFRMRATDGGASGTR